MPAEELYVGLKDHPRIDLLASDAAEPDAPVVLTGSHVDTTLNANVLTTLAYALFLPDGEPDAADLRTKF